MSPTKIQKYLERFPSLPDTAFVPIAVAAAHDGVCERTITRSYPVVELAPNRKGVNVGFLRNRQQQTANA
jgi:hypothetical protein